MVNRMFDQKKKKRAAEITKR
uniref:Uncharacterized protein n=1 Tax=Rhizophora mucronata TaxID=61149 RepID=A0A2P2IN65_RHIMU